MWSGKEHKDSPGRRAEDRAADTQATPAQPCHVGSLLRRAREAQNEDLRVTATHLRIRDTYLRAIEDGRFDELPSGAYSLGFVRAYAIHLGLDGDKLVQRFKDEQGGAVRMPALVIPEPQPEGRVPGGALVMASLLLAAGAYGGWYYVSSLGRVAEAPAVDDPPRAVAAAPAAAPARPRPVPATGGIDTSIAAAPRGTTPAPAAGPALAARTMEKLQEAAAKPRDADETE